MFPHVLILESDLSFAHILEAVLDDVGYAYTHCRTDADALRLLSISAIPCIVVFSFNVTTPRTRLLQGVQGLSLRHSYIALAFFADVEVVSIALLPQAHVLNIPFAIETFEATILATTVEVTQEYAN